jgi:hypothetical protein
MEACHIIGTALLQSIARIGTQSTMKGSRKTLKEFSPHIHPIHPTNTVEREDKQVYEQNIACGHS